ncbi:MAG: enoyl-CoA hydratase/isomerase family protein [Deltaproteobacteria bacterium]|uniref:Enoyl-CoA hydratase/isomerase family protein n=1 Tax=Candidatus Desulfacyla euxinica TaxID=2841693 RepID=A0A8J6T288_9DELT|nr:enoyl-CoA hydratase/isomerase family protein [Candidatus Desulfacyla euxinica]
MMTSYGKIYKLTKEGELGIVTFDVSAEGMNTWTREAIDEAGGLIEDLEKASDLKGVIFISGKPENFHAGANLNLLDEMKDPEDTAKAMGVFHTMFNRLEALPYPTVAAIHGHCLGGGLEFALACTARIAKESKTTLIGLPECSLGIFPGGGGTQRLPRLIGYGAIELILKGKMLPAAKAHSTGIVDLLVGPEGDLLKEAIRFTEKIAADPNTLQRKDQDFSQIDAVADMARQEVLKVTRGREIPGPMLAIKAIQEGAKVTLEEGLKIEKNLFVEAVLSNQAKGGIHIFFLKTMSDKPKNMMTKGFEPKPINKVGILGFGTMGRGIIIDILRNTQIPVVVKDVPQALEPGKTFVKKILEKLAEKKKLKAPVEDLMGRLTVTSEYGQELKEADLVVEAVFEDIKVKKEVYEELSQLVKEDCIIASNTSSIPLNAMAQYVSRPERFGGAHFFSPVWLMQLVEVIQGAETSRETVDNLLNFAALIRKRPIVCKDHPGFVVNAVLFPYFMKSLEFLEAGNTIENIDGAFTRFGLPVGPIRLMDEVGIDISYNVLKGKGMEQGTLKNVVGDGRMGFKKSGKGFFLEDGSVDPTVLPLISLKEKREISAEQMQTEVLTEMVKIGHALLEKGIVSDPRMIDIGMIWGTGFPADRGGPMKWADLIGLSDELFGKTFY